MFKLYFKYYYEKTILKIIYFIDDIIIENLIVLFQNISCFLNKIKRSFEIIDTWPFTCKLKSKNDLEKYKEENKK